MRPNSVLGEQVSVSLAVSHRFDHWLEKRGNARLMRRFFDVENAVKVMYGEV